MIFDKIVFTVACITSILCSRDVEVKTEEDLGVKYASRCEVCKVLATELQSRLEETGKVHDIIEIGYSLDDVQPKKKTKYQKSELRLIESLDGVCDRILEYNIHKERQDSTRFAKGMSQTFKTLHGLVDKGVKVDLGIPYELWDKPSAEITHLKTQCESLLEDNEEAIEHWYWYLQGSKDLKIHLCNDHALRDSDKSCLFEEVTLKGDRGESETSKKKKKVKDESVDPSDSNVKEKQDSEDNLNHKYYEEQYPEKVDSAQNKKLRKRYTVEGLSNKPNLEKSANSDKRGEEGQSYWTEPTEYIKNQMKEEEILKKSNELKTNELKSEGLGEFNVEREEL